MNVRYAPEREVLTKTHVTIVYKIDTPIKLCFEVKNIKQNVYYDHP